MSTETVPILATAGLDDFCSVCRSEAVVIEVRGTEPCYYCGNTVSLCQPCFERLKAEIASL